MIDAAAQARLERWKLSLLDLSSANRLIDVKDGTTTIPLPSVDVLGLAAALSEGAAFTVAPGPAADRGEGHVLRSPLAQPELMRRLVAIRRAARAQLADGGVHTLWLGLGMLVWCDTAEQPLEPKVRGAADSAAGAAGDAGDAGDGRDASAASAAPAANASDASAVGDASDARAAADGDGEPDARAAGNRRGQPDAADGAEGDAGAGVMRRSPLALWPVELVREPGGGLRLVEAAGVEPRCNQTLREKLRRELGAVLPDGEAPGGDGELDLAGLLAAAEAIAADRPGWRVERSAELGIFGFAKFVMWNDLDARAGELVASSVVAHLAAGCGTAFVQASPEAARAVAGDAPITDLIAPLDADASQLAAVAAAAAGASFVLQGPPGTGKSQTIANLIAHCVANGRTVLFATDKMAALDVVHQRLAAIGLGEACLALHSHRAVRAQVVAQLGRVLERAFRPVAGSMAGDARLGELRAALDGHVAAMHRTGPFGRSLHDVLGRLVELRTTARAALAERDAAGLDRAAFERRKLAVEALAAATRAVEPVASHPWRASTRERWPLDGRERTLAALDEAAAAVAELAAAVRDVVELVPGMVGRTGEQLTALGALGALAAASQRPGAELLTQLRTVQGDDIVERIALIRARGGGAIEPPRDPGEFLVLASRHRLLAYEVNDRFTDSVAELDAGALWTQLRRWIHRPAPLRFLALRKVRAAIGAAAMPGMLETDGAIVTALEAVIAERAARAALVAAAEPARRWFGELGGDPLALDLRQIDAAVSWAGELRRAFDAVEVAGGAGRRIAAWRTLVAQVAASPAPDSPAGGELAAFARLGAAAARWRPALAALAEATGIAGAALGAGDDHLVALSGQIDALRGAIDGLRDWVAFHAARRAAETAGSGPAVLAIERGDLEAGELAAAWERATLLAWADAELAGTPALARFHGATHHAHAAAFADLDRAALTLIRARALIGIAERVPRVVSEPGGELGVLLHELKKQRGHRPLRRLFADIPTLLPRLAPCLLMSPLSIAQYLDPALPRFDVVVFDEASQLPTADAIGALARGRAAVVVGDSRQLPPTRFFAAGAPDGDADGDGDPAAEGEQVELESVLDDCVAARLPERHLTWHYRSRHEDLIAFSNRRYYGDRLQVFPAAHRSPDLGVVWRRVDGVYDRGGTRQNRVEAEAVAAEVIARLRDPAQRARSIGVVTFSRAQQALIEDLLDAARAEDPELDEGFEGRGGEPVLVKNLETIQGDERDVVIVSIGYGPDAGGRFTRNLGPLSQRGGERRLNVAITRAREQLVVFSSFDPEDLGLQSGPSPQGEADGDRAGDGDRSLRPGAPGQGVQDLAELLAFARDGGGAVRSAAADAPPAGPITAAIARALAERGWTVHHQVGCGAYKLDLAIVDPNQPDHYAMAIEHDGAAYVSAPAARDRDRLRAQVLGELGWRVHRIWALDWWADPEREVQRAHAAIVTAVAASRQRRTASTRRPLAERPPARARAAEGSAPASRAPRRGQPVPQTFLRGMEPRGASVADDPVASDARDASAAAGRSPSPPRSPRGGALGSRALDRSPAGVPPGFTRAREAQGAGAAVDAAPSVATGSGPTDAISDGLPGAQEARGAGAAVDRSPSPSVAAGSGSTDAISQRSPGVRDAHGAGAGVDAAPPAAALLADTAASNVARGSAPIRIARNAIAIGPYLAASVPAGRRAPDDLFAPRHLGEVEKIIEQVLAAEAPIHLDLLARRVGAYFGIGRLTARVTEQVRAALAGRGRWGDEDDVVWRLDQDPDGVPAVRVAGQAASERRAIHEVPLAEVAAAARIVVERAVGIAASDLVRDAARLLGFSRTTDRVVERVAAGVRLAAQRELIRIEGGKATLPD